MSRYEYNKGKLVPFGVMDEERAISIVKEVPKYYDNAIDAIREDAEYGVVELNGEWYQVSFDIRRGDFDPDFCDIQRNENGTINFSSNHYNGGAHWTEVLEEALKK